MGLENSKNVKNNNYKIYETVYQTIYWIDKDINNIENKNHQQHFKKELNLFQIKAYDNIEDFIEEIKLIKFKIIFVIIAGNLYGDYFLELKELKNDMTNILLSIIFTSTDFKKILLNEEPNKYNIKQEILDSIKDSYYNYGGVTDNRNDIVNFIKFFLGFKYKSKPDYSNALTFEIIDENNLERLIFPSIYGSLQMRENIIDDEDIDDFNNILIKRHDYAKNGINELIYLYRKIGKIPLEILAKYWIRYYTSESSFYSLMNLQFMENKYDDYEPFVKILYKGLDKGFLQSKSDEELYRCQSISKKEFDRIVKAIKNYKKIQIYSRAFLSFTLNENKSHNFLRPETEDLIPIKFKIKPKKDGEIFSSNADIRQYSIYNEEEILFFPFSSFIIEDGIEIENIGGINARIIYLNYLGKYEKEIKLKICETLDKNVDIEEIMGINKDWKFTNDIINKTMKEKYKKGLDFLKMYFKDEMKNVLNGKKKKKSLQDENLNYIISK